MPSVPVIVDRIPPKAQRMIVLGLRLVIAAVFVAAAVPKLLDPVAFAQDIENYHATPESLIGPLAVALPVLELVVAAALITGVHAPGAALVAAVMLLVFAGGMAQAIARGIDLDCGCFGTATETQVSGLTITRNLLLTLACVPIVLARRRAPEPVRVEPAG